METKTRIAGIVIQDGKILMEIGKGYSELWTPGGKIEGTETDEECLARELREELELELVRAKFFKEYSSPDFYNDKRTIIDRVYVIEITGTPNPSAEIEKCVWFAKEDFENKKYPMLKSYQDIIFPDLIREGVW